MVSLNSSSSCSTSDCCVGAGEEALAWALANPDRELEGGADRALLPLLLLVEPMDSAWGLADASNGAADVECDVDSAAACIAAFRSARCAARFARRASTSLLSSGLGAGGSCARTRSKSGMHVILQRETRETRTDPEQNRAKRMGRKMRTLMRLRPYQVGQLLVELGKLDQHICQFRLSVRQTVHHLRMLNVFVKVEATLRRGRRKELWVSDRRLSLLCWTRGRSYRASNHCGT